MDNYYHLITQNITLPFVVYSNFSHEMDWAIYSYKVCLLLIDEIIKLLMVN